MITLKVDGFDWDSGNRAKCQKHGVTIAEIEELFLGGPLVAPDPKHSRTEDRFIAIGKTHVGRHALVAFTLRAREGRQFIRRSRLVTCTRRR